MDPWTSEGSLREGSPHEFIGRLVEAPVRIPMSYHVLNGCIGTSEGVISIPHACLQMFYELFNDSKSVFRNASMSSKRDIAH